MMLRLALLGAVMAVLGFLLSETGFRARRLFSVLCAVLLVSAVGDGIAEVLGFTRELAEGAGVGDITACALKIVGASYLFGICADVATDLGEGGIAAALNAAYRVETLLIVLPYLRELTAAALELI